MEQAVPVTDSKQLFVYFLAQNKDKKNSAKSTKRRKNIYFLRNRAITWKNISVSNTNE
jgi:hypothetical protein